MKSASQGRNQTVEALRVLAAFAIVWYHSKAPGMEIAYSGLSFFILLSVSLAMQHRAPRQGRLFEQLLLPWAIWYAIYAVVNVAMGKPVIETGNGLIAGLLASPSIHLWYLPFIWLVLTLSGFLARPGERPAAATLLFVTATVASVASILAIPYWVAPSVAAGYPWAQYAQAVTPVLLALMLGLANSRAQRGVVLAMVALLLWAAIVFPQEGVALPHAIALAALMAASAFPIPWLERRNIQWLSSCMLGVYLVHPIFIGVAKRLVSGPVPLQVVLAFALSLSFVVLYRNVIMRKTARKWLM